VLFGQRPSFFLLDLSFSGEVTFQAHQYFAYVLLGIAFDLLDPSSDVFETLLVIDRVGQDYACCSFVVGLGDVFEPLLPSSIPDLQFHLGSIDIDGFKFKVDTDGGYVAVFEDSVAKFSEEDGFAYPAVTDDDDFGKEFNLT